MLFRDFSDPKNFAKPAKFYWKELSPNKKKHPPQISWSPPKKIFSPIGLKMAEKRGVKLVFDTKKTSFEKNAK